MNYNPTTLLQSFALLLKNETLGKTGSPLSLTFVCYLFLSLNSSILLQFKAHFCVTFLPLIFESHFISFSSFLFIYFKY